eukprot:TRINITY_DN17287_c0_g1_i2.p2 TRINITY_DN17287_c0_g1~~TRINITY_DN17287_c0_g1_i2.p2  ORF type:complete len:132 (-),score=47.42 TRINITY_DN17287_c0_g1_i2:450-845(-)
MQHMISLCQGTSMLMQKLKIDDVVDAVAVHGACGIWGVLACGIFGNPDEGMGGNGFLYGGDNIGTQIVGVLLIIVFVGAVSSAIFFPLKMAKLLRLSDAFQDEGADIMEHTPTKAYGDKPAAAVKEAGAEA